MCAVNSIVHHTNAHLSRWMPTPAGGDVHELWVEVLNLNFPSISHTQSRKHVAHSQPIKYIPSRSKINVRQSVDSQKTCARWQPIVLLIATDVACSLAAYWFSAIEKMIAPRYKEMNGFLLILQYIFKSIYCILMTTVRPIDIMIEIDWMI